MTGQAHDIIAVGQLLTQTDDGHVQIEQHLPLPIVAHHALSPEDGGQALTACHRFNPMQAGCRIDNSVTGFELDLMCAIRVFDHQFTAVVVRRVAEEERARQVSPHALAAGGADIIELGVPFSDPMADGPVIQQAAERALARGIGTPQVLGFVRDFRRDDNRTPVVLMGYANPIESMGYDAFAQAMHASGADGAIIVDLPPEEDGELAPYLRTAGLHMVRLATPTTDAVRLPLSAQLLLPFPSTRGASKSAAV